MRHVNNTKGQTKCQEKKVIATEFSQFSKVLHRHVTYLNIFAKQQSTI